MSPKTIFVGMVAVLLLGTATYFHQIDSRSLWEDEGWTLLLSLGDSAHITQTIAYDQHTPLYFLLIRPWLNLMGESEFGLRSLSAFFSLLSVAVIYQLGRVLFNSKVGFIGALLLAIWDFPLDLAQDARQYSLLTLLTLLSCLFYACYTTQATRPNGLGWLIFSILALYTQYMAGVVLAIQLLHSLLFIRPWQKLGDVLLRWGFISAAFLPWLPVFIHQNQVRWDDPIYYQSGLPNNTATFIFIRDALLTRQFGLIVGLALLGLLTLVYSPRFKIQLVPARWTAFLALWLGLYIGLLVWLNESREILRIRLFIVVIPPLLLLVARGLQNLQAIPQIFLVGVILTVNLTTIDSRQNHAPWREVVGNVTALHQTNEPILMDIWVGDFPARYYVRRQMGEDTPWLSLRELRREQKDYFLPALVDYIDDESAFWLLRWNDDPTEYDNLLAEQGFQRTASPYVEHEGNQLYSHRYDRLTDDIVASFGDSIQLLKTSVTGEKELTVTLWWVAQTTPPLDYSVSVFALSEKGEIIAQQDSSPLVPTSQWEPDQIHYDQHRLILPVDIPKGHYLVGVRMYWYADPQNPLAVSTQDGLQSNPTFVTIQTFEIND